MGVMMESNLIQTQPKGFQTAPKKSIKLEGTVFLFLAQGKNKIEYHNEIKVCDSYPLHNTTMKL